MAEEKKVPTNRNLARRIGMNNELQDALRSSSLIVRLLYREVYVLS